MVIAKMKETGVILKDELEPCMTQRKHPKTAQHTAVQPSQRLYADLLGPMSPSAKGGYSSYHITVPHPQ